MTFTFYATVAQSKVRSYMPDVAYMLPASSWARVGLKAPKLPRPFRTAADCGGFVATKIWGDYRYTPEQYVTWLESFRPEWAATMDYCCEDEITAGKPGIVLERQQRTTEMAYRFWTDYRSASWSWVPTVQGWNVEDYVRHARDLKSLIDEMRRADRYQMFRVGIGTLCARASANMVQRVVRAVVDELPGVPLHLWGVKLSVLQSSYSLPQVVSVDSGAWNGLFGRGRTEWKESGLKQAEYEFNVALPRYLNKVEAALMKPKQSLLL
jgi:hypothetical protein